MRTIKVTTASCQAAFSQSGVVWRDAAHVLRGAYSATSCGPREAVPGAKLVLPARCGLCFHGCITLVYRG